MSKTHSKYSLHAAWIVLLFAACGSPVQSAAPGSSLTTTPTDSVTPSGATTSGDMPTQPALAPFSATDCTFDTFPASLGGATATCERITYSPEACQSYNWFEGQTAAASGKICLGFQRPAPGKRCSDNPGNINCYLATHPGACNYLNSSVWSACLNELYLTCIEKGDLGGGAPIWVTPAASIAMPYSRWVTGSEYCHWFNATGTWPNSEASN